MPDALLQQCLRFSRIGIARRSRVVAATFQKIKRHQHFAAMHSGKCANCRAEAVDRFFAPPTSNSPPLPYRRQARVKFSAVTATRC